jgi:hypothetical protein
MTPDDRWIDRARFDAEHAKRVWAGSADAEDAPAWYGRVATLIRSAAAPGTDDELAGEADIVARMQAAILEPAPDDELDGEPDIVARMQATILDLRASTEGDEVEDGDRPRHLRAAAGGRDGARRRGARVVSRIVAAKAAAVTTVVAIGVTAAAATTGIVATVVVPALTSHEEKQPRPPQEAGPTAESESSGDSSGRVGDRDGGDVPNEPPITLQSGEPLACMFRLDCLMDQVEKAASTTPPKATTGPAVDSATPSDSTVVDPNAAPPQPETPPATSSEIPAEPEPTTTTTTEPPPAPTTTTTEPPPPPPTTTTTAPTQPVELAAPAATTTSPAELAAQTGESGDARAVTEPTPAG